MISRVVFRADASVLIGTGHVMRCLTLADALHSQGVTCYFISREHPGNLLEFIRQRGYQVYPLPLNNEDDGPLQDVHPLQHAAWLGASQQVDADQCCEIVRQIKPDWLVVDHYALDHQWHDALRDLCAKIMVIDDLADRMHNCDLLLDQTYGRESRDYEPKVPKQCELLCGAEYALLRAEFPRWREYSLRRRHHGVLRNLLINLGGVDKDNVTSRILMTLKGGELLPEQCQITVVMGITSPWIEQIRRQAEDMGRPTTVVVGVDNMAELMAASDLAIGAAGATSWERCCLGVPTIMLVLADNQKTIAQNLFLAKAVELLDGEMLETQLQLAMQAMAPVTLSGMSKAAAALTSGRGCAKIVERLRTNQ